MTFDSIIIGSGVAGSVMARSLADKGKKVLIIERRHHIGGNCYDEFDDHGILVHTYGPHIFHTSKKNMCLIIYHALQNGMNLGIKLWQISMGH